MKTCKKCGLLLDGGRFSPDKRHSDGLQSVCKDCHNIWGKEYYYSHVEEYSQRAKEYRAIHGDEINAQQKEYKTMFPDRASKKYKKYRDTHLDKCKDKDKRYRAEHPDVMTCQRQRRRARIKEVGGTGLSAQEWGDIKSSYGNRCIYCHTSSDKLEPDHVVPVSRGGEHSPINIVPACKSCNGKKGAKSLLVFMRSLCNE